MKERYDQNCLALELELGDLVLLSTKSHHLLEGFRKQQEQFVGSYVVKERVHPNAYRLIGLLARVPSTQNICFLIKFHRSPNKFSSRPDPGASAPDLIRNHYEWEVQEVVGHKETREGMQYLVKWKGFACKQWLPERNMDNSKGILCEYHHKVGILLICFCYKRAAQGQPSTPPAL